MTALSRLSLRNRALTALLTIFFIIAGVYATGTLKRELIPSIQFPVVAVVTPVPGAGASVVEERVTKPVEAAVLGLRGVDKVASTSSNSVSTVLVTLQYGTDVGQAQTDAQRAALNLQNLPEDATPQVIAGSLDDFPIISMSVSGGTDQQQLLSRVRSQMVPAIGEIDGVRDVQVSGVTDQVISIDVDPRKLAASGMTPDTLTNLLKNNGVLIPAGKVTAGRSELNVQVGTPIRGIKDLAALPLGVAPQPTTTAGRSGVVTLGDVATVTLAPGEVAALSRTDGKPSLTLAITKTPDGNTVAISNALQQLRPELESKVVDGKTQVVFDQAPFIEKSVKDLATEGGLGLLFAVLVVFLFLMSLRMTLVTAVSIPLSLLIALLGLKISGYTLNILTLGALTIAVGRVVDDSIVVIENIERHLEMGQDKAEAIPEAVREVATAVTSSTLATVAVFLPLGLVGGQVGELFRPFALTVTLAMLASLFVALTIVPVLGYWFLKNVKKVHGSGAPTDAQLPHLPDGDERTAAGTHPGSQARDTAAPVSASVLDSAPVSGRVSAGGDPVRLREQDEPVTRLQKLYLPALTIGLAKPLITVLLGVLLLALSGFGATFLKTDFIGNAGGNTLTMTQSYPVGTSLQALNRGAQVLEAQLADRPEVESYQVTVGSVGPFAAFTGGGNSSATFNITTSGQAEDTAKLTDDLRSFGDRHPELGTITLSSGAAGPGASQAEIVVTAPDDTTLREAAAAITAAMKKVDGARDVTNDLAALVPTVKVTVLRARAQMLGLSETAVGGVVASALRGANLGEVTIDGVGHDVILRRGDAPAGVEQLKALPVGSGPSGVVRLGTIAAVEQVQEPASLTRTDGARSATISATPATDDLGSVTAELNRVVADTKLPGGVVAKVGGVSADQAEAFGQLAIAVVIAIAITYAILVATFGSLLQPLILMVSIPFAATGAVGLLLISGQPFGVASMIGLLMLVGIVVTNAIVLIDLVNQYRGRGLGIRDAVLEGARHRLRPIIMTALATIFALTPMAFALTGGGAFISQPLAIVVIGGLLSSTLLTLIIVPALYVLLEEFRHRRGFGADHRGEV